MRQVTRLTVGSTEPTDDQTQMPPMARKTPEFTLGLTPEQEEFATEYVHAAYQTGPDRRYRGEVDEIEHGSGEITLRLIDQQNDDEVVAEATFSTTDEDDELDDFVREVGQFWYDNGRLGAEEQNALNYIRLCGGYAAGDLTADEIEELQEEFEDDHDFVKTGLKSLQFRKKHDQEGHR